MRRTIFGIALLLFANVTFATERVRLRGPDANGQWFDVASHRGRHVAITFASRKTKDDATTINEALAKHDVIVVGVVDLRDVPGFAHDLAQKKMRKKERPGKVHFIVDKNGSIARGFGVDPRQHVDIFLVDKRGRMMGHFVGVAQLHEAEMRLEHDTTRQARRAKR